MDMQNIKQSQTFKESKFNQNNHVGAPLEESMTQNQNNSRKRGAWWRWWEA